jgi:uncharacterized protein (DUF362 family)
MQELSRRGFLRRSAIAGGTILMGGTGEKVMAREKITVSLVHTSSRRDGVQASIQALQINPVKGKNVLVKPNFNTADYTPGSTHNETLIALIETLWEMGAKSISLGERSYAPTREVMEEKGILPLLGKRDVRVIHFDDLEEKDWIHVKPKGTHWADGFRIARPVLESECLVSTCCLKTHQYGGVFTLSLKLHVGVVPASRNGFPYMKELHGSPHQRKLIAEINEPFKPSLVVLDGVEAFVDGGPATGKRARGDVFIASTDRVAIDAAGVAILKHLGSNPKIMKPKIFEQEQIARAVEIGLGAASPSEIDLVPADEKSRDYRDRIAGILNNG